MISKKNVFRNAARYLGFRGKALDAGAIRLLEDAYGALLTTVEPRHILRPFPVMVTGEKLCFGELPPLESRDLCNLMRGAGEGYGLVATLGTALDLRVRREMVMNPALGAALSACGSAYVDEYIDELLEAENELCLLRGRRLSPRFSPGYGDAPLDWQRSLLAVLEARRIGVSLTEGCLMLPEKSVSAVMAVRPVDSRRNAPKSGCAACDLSECAYRREEME